MSVTAADLCKAIDTLWESSGLNAVFNTYWDAAALTQYPVLHDGEATPQQPWPYCVFEVSAGDTTVRMSAGERRGEIHDVPSTFRVHAKPIDGDARTAKEVAADLAEEIVKVFGGHPIETASEVTLDNGSHLLSQLTNDYGLRTGDSEYMWTINYLHRLAVPVAS